MVLLVGKARRITGVQPQRTVAHMTATASLRRREALCCLLGGLLSPASRADQHTAPAIMLAQVYRPGPDLHAYWLSEKYDGVRGRWDGQQLVSRGGQRIHAPAWFTAGWPEHALDGELWAGRERFEETVSTVRQHQSDDQAWRALRFMVFDWPDLPGTFDQRLRAGQLLLAQVACPWLVPVPQERASTHDALLQRLDQVVRAGGEGLMLHRGDALYRTERSDALLKVKTHEDAEARVIGHEPGRGRHTGRLGALWVETPQGLRFRIGSGLSDALREHPPPVGSLVTYRFRGRHASGLPRFATFQRQRSDADLNGPR
jgi:DNA ligase-1